MFHKFVLMNFITDFYLMSLITPQVANKMIKDYANAVYITMFASYK